jgi:hypothetical protein
LSLLEAREAFLNVLDIGRKEIKAGKLPLPSWEDTIRPEAVGFPPFDPPSASAKRGEDGRRKDGIIME